ncbi:hypothetical protein HDU81_004837 [Chytriomyces hyalinus]|nr:hypothetical protein HDU81_004837 [Chytriomyces hyalinus]
MVLKQGVFHHLAFTSGTETFKAWGFLPLTFLVEFTTSGDTDSAGSSIKSSIKVADILIVAKKELHHVAKMNERGDTVFACKMASPPKSISDKLRLLCQECQRIDANEIVFNPSDYYFGFKVMHQLFPVDLHEVEGYPCMAFNEITDPVKFGVKVIPLDNQFDVGDKHPALVESRLLKEFTNLVLQHVTPPVTFVFKNLDTHNKTLSRTALFRTTGWDTISKRISLLIWATKSDVKPPPSRWWQPASFYAPSLQ